MTTSTVANTPRPGSPGAFLLASRPATLSAALVPVAVGSACAYAAGGFSLGPAIAALLGASFLQIGANFANDVFDFEKGADTEARLGPVRAAQAGLLTPYELRVAMVVAFALATLSGVYLTWVAGPVVLMIGVASIASAVAYTGGPFPLGYNGLGDLFVMIFFGFVAVMGTALVQVGAVPALAVFASIPVGALATAILVVNNLRDADGDAKVGKRTLAVRFGPSAAKAEYALLVAAAYAVPIALFSLGRSGPAVLLPLLSAPLAWPLLRSVWSDRGRALNATLVRTAKLLLVHGLLFAAGLALGR
jgi:1,4-dihydroxy-2-naphthoate polyprenyltransferase